MKSSKRLSTMERLSTRSFSAPLASTSIAERLPGRLKVSLADPGGARGVEEGNETRPPDIPGALALLALLTGSDPLTLLRELVFALNTHAHDRAAVVALLGRNSNGDGPWASRLAAEPCEMVVGHSLSPP